ncbi:cellulose synthase, nucleotide-diphospho-sugar transferase [Artemisia annua]|uniref:Cellulose synthase, nucleotide-diphospho-sugar transferase n=1 Tax=Artemisia annua TaxID=35608 RepID=A0A2U1PBD8_ARTAN|nr:cellulose synthase, nucleotide-diphospho-sugar transferase [Artemisia annua]
MWSQPRPYGLGEIQSRDPVVSARFFRVRCAVLLFGFCAILLLILLCYYNAGLRLSTAWETKNHYRSHYFVYIVVHLEISKQCDLPRLQVRLYHFHGEHSIINFIACTTSSAPTSKATSSTARTCKSNLKENLPYRTRPKLQESLTTRPAKGTKHPKPCPAGNYTGKRSKILLDRSYGVTRADLVLAFLWTTWQAFFINPIHHQLFLENLPEVAKESDYPGLDVFVCTADPFKEPPVGVVNTVLSVLAYDYPTEKLSVYVSDDGGSQLTLFAFMECAKFARHWLPYCRKYNIMDRSPEVHFANDTSLFPETKEIQVMYAKMKATIEGVVDQGSINVDQLIDDRMVKAFSKWNPGFTCHQHPTVVEVLLKSDKDKDVTDHYMPNLFYLAREKNQAIPHRFKAGALNTLIRVSTIMTNAPLILILDCDMYSNDPKTPLRALCYFLDPNIDPKLAFVQFPQRFHNINKTDTYGLEHLLETQVCSIGMDGLGGTIFMGSGGIFKRQVLLENHSTPHKLWNETKESEDVSALTHRVASCVYEENTKWGSEIGFRYGTLVEDIYTGFRLHCSGWKSVTCNPTRAAFLGGMPIAFNDFLCQSSRWYLGLLQTGLSKFSPVTFGMKFLNPLHGMCYVQFHFRVFWCIPIIIYAFLPQLALINSFPIFPKVSDPWFCLYAFLFLGSYGKDLYEFVMAGSVFQKWWNRQRMVLILGSSCFPLSIFNWLLASLRLSTFEFNVTSKVLDTELSKRYEKGIFEFGVDLPLLLPVSVAALINLLAFVMGIKEIVINIGRFEDFLGQLFIAGFGMVNSWPIYEAMVLRNDKGKMPIKTTIKSVCATLAICFVFGSAF